MKDQIYEFIKRGNVSLAELTKRIPGFKGDMQWRLAKNENIIIWQGMSNEAIDAIESLLDEKKISIKPCHFLVYMCDGVVPNFPIVKRNYKYKTPHWLPVALNRCKNVKKGSAGRKKERKKERKKDI